MVACDSYNLVASDHKNFDGIQQQNVTLPAYAESNPVSLRRQPGGLYLRARQTHMCAHVSPQNTGDIKDAYNRLANNAIYTSFYLIYHK